MDVKIIGKAFSNRISDYLFFENDYCKIYCMDSEKYLINFTNKEFDLCLTDPPYNIHQGRKPTGFLRGRHGNKARENYNKIVKWDKKISKNCFDEIKRISENQIIWGYNYYASILGNCKEPLFWDKVTGDSFFADGEIAYTSFKGTCRKFVYQWAGCFQGGSANVEKYLHPNQKPVALFEWCLNRYANKNDYILDCFAGRGTTALAVLKLNIEKDMNLRCVLIDNDFEYCQIQKDEILRYMAELKNEYYLPENELFKNITGKSFEE